MAVAYNKTLSHSVRENSRLKHGVNKIRRNRLLFWRYLTGITERSGDWGFLCASMFKTKGEAQWSRDSSVGIVTSYGLDCRGIAVGFPAGIRDFSLYNSVQTGSGVHPASYTMGTWGSFPEGVGEGGVELTTYLHLVRRLTMAQLYICSPTRLHGVFLSTGKTLPLHAGRTQRDGAGEERTG
jgi:hypothetical protein